MKQSWIVGGEPEQQADLRLFLSSTKPSEQQIKQLWRKATCREDQMNFKVFPVTKSKRHRMCCKFLGWIQRLRKWHGALLPNAERGSGVTVSHTTVAQWASILFCGGEKPDMAMISWASRLLRLEPSGSEFFVNRTRGRSWIPLTEANSGFAAFGRSGVFRTSPQVVRTIQNKIDLQVRFRMKQLLESLQKCLYLLFSCFPLDTELMLIIGSFVLNNHGVTARKKLISDWNAGRDSSLPPNFCQQRLRAFWVNLEQVIEYIWKFNQLNWTNSDSKLLCRREGIRETVGI